MCVLVAQSCLILCNPIDYSPPGSSLHRILQARTLEWAAISLSKRNQKEWKWSLSVVSNSLKPHGLYVAYQVPPSMEFSRQEYWSGLPFPSPGDLPYPGIEPRSPALQTLYPLSHQGRHWLKTEVVKVQEGGREVERERKKRKESKYSWISVQIFWGWDKGSLSH